MEFRRDPDSLPSKSYDELISERNALADEYKKASFIQKLILSSKITKVDKEITKSMRCN